MCRLLIWSLRMASESTTASKQPRSSNLVSDLKSVTSITYISMCILFIWPLIATSEATAASKQPRRSNLSSDLKSVTSITYMSMCILFIWSLMEASEATTASKQPQRSVRLSQESSLTYVNMFQDMQVATMSPISLVHKIFPGGKMTLTTASSSSDWNLGAIDFAVATAPLVIIPTKRRINFEGFMRPK